MNTDRSRQPTPPAQAPAPGESTLGSGEGANTALEALIRQRKLAETPDQAPPPPSTR